MARFYFELARGYIWEDCINGDYYLCIDGEGRGKFSSLLAAEHAYFAILSNEEEPL